MSSSSETKMVVFERQLARTKLLVTLAGEVRDKLVLNEKYLRHLRGLLEEAAKTSVDLKICHEDRKSAAHEALQELAKLVQEVDRSKEAVDQIRDRVRALGLDIHVPGTAAPTTSSEQGPGKMAEQGPAKMVDAAVDTSAAPCGGAEPKRVSSASPGLSRVSSRGEGARGAARFDEAYPKRLTRNSIIKHFDLPTNKDEFFNAFRSDQPPERLVDLHRRLQTLPEDLEDQDQEGEKPSASHTPVM